MPYVPWGQKPIVNLSELRVKRAQDEFRIKMLRLGMERPPDVNARAEVLERQYRRALLDDDRANPGRC